MINVECQEFREQIFAFSYKSSLLEIFNFLPSTPPPHALSVPTPMSFITNVTTTVSDFLRSAPSFRASDKYGLLLAGIAAAVLAFLHHLFTDTDSEAPSPAPSPLPI